jgi:hypothetical protein
MANYSRILLVSALLGLTALPAGATGDATPTVVGSFAEQVSINKTRFILMFNGPIENLTGDEFQVSAGCTFGYLEILDATAQVELLDCPSGQVELVLFANTVGSSVLGPAENHVISIEIDVPTPDLPAPPSTPTPPTNPTPEPTPTPPPISNPEPTPNPDPAPTPPPVAESPTTSPETQQSSSPSVSDSAVTTVSESVAVDWDEELVVVTVTPPANNELEGTSSNQESVLAALQLEGEVQEKGSPNPVEVTSEELVVEPVAGDELEFDQTRGSQWIWLIGLGSLTLLITGLIRRFSGR